MQYAGKMQSSCNITAGGRHSNHCAGALHIINSRSQVTRSGHHCVLSVRRNYKVSSSLNISVSFTLP